jgi:hypothetical protein
MSNYALVENNEVVGVYSHLPTNWKNVSNFFALEGDDDTLKTFGWYKVVKTTPSYDPTTQRLEGVRSWYDVETDTAYTVDLVVDIPVYPEHSPFLTEEELEQQRLKDIETRWIEVRIERDKRMKDFEWRYVRYERQVRLSLTTTDNITDLDQYMQSLADITTQSDPYNIVWPTYNASES